MSSRLTIEGGIPLSGTVKASGAKNAALPILAATILMSGESEILNVPHLKDIVTIIRMLNALGVRAEYHSPNRVKIWNNRKIRHIAPYELVTAMRASFFVAGPLLAKTGYAKVPLPGGCSIGSRPVDIHLKGFKALGATVDIEHGFVEMRCKSLKGTKIYLDFPSVGATENIMMAACLAEGETIIENCAREPEITDLAYCLIAAGAKIEGIDSSTLIVQGVRDLHGVRHSVISDRVEAGTLLIAGAITHGNITVENVQPDHLAPLLLKLKECDLKLDVGDTYIRVLSNGHIQPTDVETLPFPGFPTDMQAQMMSLLTLANGHSVMKETIFENRFMHAHELVRMGAKIKLDNSYALITGVEKLSGAEVKITDLRAGAALILAGLAAEGKTTVYGLKHLERGYEDLPGKIRSLGGKIFE